LGASTKRHLHLPVINSGSVSIIQRATDGVCGYLISVGGTPTDKEGAVLFRGAQYLPPP